jgi:hypothetical protein
MEGTWTVELPHEEEKTNFDIYSAEHHVITNICEHAKRQQTYR